MHAAGCANTRFFTHVYQQAWSMVHEQGLKAENPKGHQNAYVRHHLELASNQHFNFGINSIRNFFARHQPCNMSTYFPAIIPNFELEVEDRFLVDS